MNNVINCVPKLMVVWDILGIMKQLPYITIVFYTVSVQMLNLELDVLADR